MTRRFLTSVGVLAVVTAVVSLPAVAGQARTAGVKTKAEPSAKTTGAATRTPWGDPDLQGVWNDATSTPLERPRQVGEKPVLGDEEAAGFQEELAFNLTRDRRDGGPEADVNRAYNEHWMDARRLKITPDRRTSLIVDPPDGRIPPLVPLTPERQKARAERAAVVARFNAGLPNSAEELSLPVRCIIRTDLALSRWTDVRISERTSISGWGTRVATGTARRSSSRQPTSGRMMM